MKRKELLLCIQCFHTRCARCARHQTALSNTCRSSMCCLRVSSSYLSMSTTFSIMVHAVSLSRIDPLLARWCWPLRCPSLIPPSYCQRAPGVGAVFALPYPPRSYGHSTNMFAFVAVPPKESSLGNSVSAAVPDGPEDSHLCVADFRHWFHS